MLDLQRIREVLLGLANHLRRIRETLGSYRAQVTLICALLVLLMLFVAVVYFWELIGILANDPIKSFAGAAK